MIWPLTKLPRWSGHPKPSDARFDGLTVLVAAANTSLGLEAAKKLAVAGASTLIITARDEAKGKDTKNAIESHLAAHSISTCKIIPLTLEMSDIPSVHAFMTSLTQVTSHLDHAILNAGVFVGDYKQLPSTYESSIQINAVATILLSLLLLPLLKASPLAKQPSTPSRPHLTYVSSWAAFQAQLYDDPAFATSIHPAAELSKREHFPTGTLAGYTQYGRSKLLLEHAIRRIAFLPFISDGASPAVLVTSVDPGPTSTGIFRDYTSSPIWGAVIGAGRFVLRSAAQGANIYISSLITGDEARGEMWMDDEVVKGDILKNVKGQQGLEVGQRVWDEICQVVKASDGPEGTLAKVLCSAS